MSFIIKPLETDDAATWVEVHHEAFYPLMPYLWHTPEYSPESLAILEERRAKSLKNPETVVYKAIDTSNNKIAAVADWSVFLKERTEEELQAGTTTGTLVKEMNADARGKFIGGLKRARAKIVGTQPCLVLETLTVRPEYQRKGIGKLLMQKVVDETDRLGLLAYLEASSGGRPLYEKYGFETVDEVEFDARPFGGDEVDVHAVSKAYDPYCKAILKNERS